MKVIQFSTMNALMLGHFEGFESVSDVIEHGNCGIGTYEGLNGESIIIDGHAYNGLPGGGVVEADDDERMAFGMIVEFETAGTVFQQKDVSSIEELKKYADEVRLAECKSDNYPCVARIDGVFDSVMVRSCSKQEPPYSPMYEVAKNQVESTMEDIEGTMIGFWFPRYMEGTNLSGWHFHFISKDRKTFGGHCLSCSLKSGMISARKISQVDLRLPEDTSYEEMDFDKDISDKVASVEGESQRD